MSQIGTRNGISFAVDGVTPATGRLPTCKAYQAVKRLIEGDVESCCDYHGEVVEHIHYHGLLAAVHEAFARHYPLMLGPDAVWITIAQGIGQHMAIHAEELRGRFVQHAGRETLRVDVSDFVPGSPENPWERAFEGWTDQIRGHVGDALYEALICDFSTTTPACRAASQVVMMDVFERYFHYEAICICGIPQITLLGDVVDWQRLREKIEITERFGLGWWLEHLRPICDQFVRAAKGDVDVQHWQRICKLREEYGGNVVNGWIAKLFPYIREWATGPVKRKNPVFETGEGFSTLYAPSGMSQVPFTLTIRRPGEAERQQAMEALGGIMGVGQDPETLGLYAKVGWAVRRASTLDVLIGRVLKEHAARPGGRQMPSDRKRDPFERTPVPADAMAFYFASNGAELFARGARPAFVIRPLEQVEQVYRGTDMEDGPPRWMRFCDLADGSFLAIDAVSGPTREVREKLAQIEREYAPQVAAEEARIRKEVGLVRRLVRRSKAEARLRMQSKVLARYEDARRTVHFNARSSANLVYHCCAGSIRPERCAVVAESFTEFLQRALENDGRYWWLAE